MGRIKALVASEAALAAALAVLALLPSCRREQEPLDRNKAPETYLTSSPTETTATDYRVHMFWRGTDNDGIVTRYIWYVSDTLLTLDPDVDTDAELRDWNPEQRIADYLRGRFTTRTDTLFIFEGFNDRTFAQINRQAFHIAAIDDGGRIDPSPARTQFLARVRGIPQVQFWVNFGAGDIPYDPSNLDTISMNAPFTIKFLGTTINNVITGYYWSYGAKEFPDANGDGIHEWLIPETQDQSVSVLLSNTGAEALPSEVFNFRGFARDEAGAISASDIITGVGVCRVVVNHDPDTDIIGADCFYYPSSGVLESLRVDFTDAVPDTFPYNSRLRMRYRGWDDPKDVASAGEDPAPIRFQFQFNRWSINEFGQRVAEKFSPWYPLRTPEDTNPGTVMEDGRDIDSTQMRIGTFDYNFLARAFDEQSRPDGTPAPVSFFGNFPPTVDSLKAGFYDQRTKTLFRYAVNDTIRFSWLAPPKASLGDLACPDTIIVNFTARTITKKYSWTILSGGHDDARDPVGSGIKGWRYRVSDPDSDLTYYREGDWLFDRPILNQTSHKMTFSITVPYVTDVESIQRQADSLIANPPKFLGLQTIQIAGCDIKDTETFVEAIRGISPTFEFDTLNNVYVKTSDSDWISNTYSVANYARRAYRGETVFLHLVR